MKRSLLLLVASLLLAVAAAPAVYAQAPIKIGVLTPLSPPGDEQKLWVVMTVLFSGSEVRSPLARDHQSR